MRYLVFILMLIQTLTACKEIRTESITKNDSGLSNKRLQHIRLSKSDGVIFSAEHGKPMMKRTISLDGYDFFTPDTSLVRQIDVELSEHYCDAIQKFYDAYYAEQIKLSKHANDSSGVKKAQTTIKKINKELIPPCHIKQGELQYFDKQFVGLFAKDGKKIVFIQLCDFRQDPYQLKPLFDTTWVTLYHHNWFLANTEIIYFDVDKGELTENRFE